MEAPLKLLDLPSEILGLIVNKVDDFRSVLSLLLLCRALQPHVARRYKQLWADTDVMAAFEKHDCCIRLRAIAMSPVTLKNTQTPGKFTFQRSSCVPQIEPDFYRVPAIEVYPKRIGWYTYTANGIAIKFSQTFKSCEVIFKLSRRTVQPLYVTYGIHSDAVGFCCLSDLMVKTPSV